MERLAYLLPLACYAVLAFAHLLPHVLPEPVERRLRLVGTLGVVLHLVALLAGVMAAHDRPGFPEALSAASLGMMVAWVWVGTGRLRALGMLLAPLGLVVLGTSLVVPHRNVEALTTTAPSPWLPVHLGLMFAGLAGFALSFAVGCLYLLVRFRLKNRQFQALGKLPPLEVLDRIQFRSTLFGFVFLTLGIGAGGAWAAASLDTPLLTDPKVWFTLVIWAWYAVALQARLFAGMRGRWSALFSIVGFAGMLFSLVLLNFLVGGWHAYAG